MPKKSSATSKPAKTRQKTSEPSVTRGKSIAKRFSVANIRQNRRDKKATKKADKKSIRQKNKLSSAFRLFRDSTSLITQHWKLFGGIILVYLILSVTLVGGLGGNINVRELRDNLVSEVGRFGSSLTLFSLLVGSAGSSNSESGAAYQTVVLIVISLATIWLLRQLLAGEKVSVRDAFYKGMYPLVPFVLVLLFVGVQLIPLAIAGFIFSAVFAGGLAVNVFEQLLWAIPVFLLVLWTIRMLGATLFALYIVTLPNMRPWAAIQAARELVRFRRWLIIRKLMFLVFALFTIGAIITVPLIILLPGVVVWLFVLLSMIGFTIAHAFIYNLYRELL